MPLPPSSQECQEFLMNRVPRERTCLYPLFQRLPNEKSPRHALPSWGVPSVRRGCGVRPSARVDLLCCTAWNVDR